MAESPQIPAPELASKPIQWAKFFPWILLAGIALIYCQTLYYPFIFDGVSGIQLNKSIRSFPAADTDLLSSRRLMVFLSLCVNFAVSGLSPVSYHLFNIVVHMANALLVYWLILLCLRLPDTHPGNPARLPLISSDLRPIFAFAIAGLWAAHPVQVQSVTYTIQRSESMAALGLLGCALAVLLHDSSSSMLRRALLSLLFAFFAFVGIYSKEVALVLPLFIYLFDSRVVTGSWLQPLKARWHLYAISILLLILPLISIKNTEMSANSTGGSAGVSQPYISWHAYFLSQPRSILHYLWISICPANLTLDLGWYVMRPGLTMVLFFIPVVALFAWTVYMLFKRPWLGFLWLGVFFVVLAPSSSFVPILDVAFEHRIYLPLLAVMVSVVALLWLGIQKMVANGTIPPERLVRSLVIAACALMLVLTARAYARTLDFRSQIEAWRAVTNTAPDNQRAWYAIAAAYVQEGLYDESLPYYERAHQLEPEDPEPLAGASLAQAKMGNFQAAVLAFDAGWPTAHRIKRSYVQFGEAALAFNDLPRAKKAYIEAIKFEPTNVIAHTNLGVILAREGDKQGAFNEFQTAYDLAPDYFDQQCNLAEAYQSLGNDSQAIKRYNDIIKHFPNQPRTYLLLSKLYMTQGLLSSARDVLDAGLQAAPNNPVLLSQRVLLSVLSRDYKTLSATQDLLIAQNPQNVRLVHDRAWTLATCPDPAFRNPDVAIAMAQAVVKATNGTDIDAIQTLAAARAARGEFDNAIKVLHEARRRAVEAKLTSALPQIDARIALFDNKQPLLDTNPLAGSPYEELDRKLNPPTATQPSTQPATQPATTQQAL